MPVPPDTCDMTFDPSSLKEAYRAQFGGNGMFTIGLMDTESPTPQEPYLSTTSSETRRRTDAPPTPRTIVRGRPVRTAPVSTDEVAVITDRGQAWPWRPCGHRREAGRITIMDTDVEASHFTPVSCREWLSSNGTPERSTLQQLSCKGYRTDETQCRSSLGWMKWASTKIPGAGRHNSSLTDRQRGYGTDVVQYRRYNSTCVYGGRIIAKK